MVGPSYVQGFRVSFWIAGRWPGEHLLYYNTKYRNQTISTTKTQSVHNQMAGRLALAISNTVWCKSTSPRDGWEMGGSLPLGISKDYGCNSVILSRCKMAGR